LRKRLDPDPLTVSIGRDDASGCEASGSLATVRTNGEFAGRFLLNVDVVMWNSFDRHKENNACTA
jgi:hypothetical protein